MRVYHFMSAKWGLAAIRHRRLKIATLDTINDPFELLGVDLSDVTHRRGLLATRDAIAKRRGMLCFSKDWRNPVQWSHYAEHHRGLCLEFEIPDALLKQVRYVADRDVDGMERMLTGDPDAAQQATETLLSTKFLHWQYEQEYRVFAALETADAGLYFAPFSKDLRLSGVIIGAKSTVSRIEIRNALAGMSKVKLENARLAFKTFDVVLQKNPKRWT